MKDWAYCVPQKNASPIGCGSFYSSAFSLTTQTQKTRVNPRAFFDLWLELSTAWLKTVSG